MKARQISHLSTSSKMEMASFDLDPKASGCADRCEYGINQVCYVLNNQNEKWPSRKQKLQRNLRFIKSKHFVIKLKFEILRTRSRQFRWFGAGDLPDLETFKKIIQICRECPSVTFWLPTSRDDILYQYFEDLGGAISPNLIIRLSAPSVAMEMPAMMKDLCNKWGITWTSTTLDDKEATCQASKDGGSCGLCEDCFKLEPVVYLIHGKRARKNAKNISLNTVQTIKRPNGERGVFTNPANLGQKGGGF